jgi:hypothetical protein
VQAAYAPIAPTLVVPVTIRHDFVRIPSKGVSGFVCAALGHIAVPKRLRMYSYMRL